jgi:hypothetical protein
VGVLVLLTNAASAGAATSCNGKDVYPGQNNLASIAENSPAGTTFCIHDGSYEVSKPVRVTDNDRFIGVYNDTTRPSVTTTQSHQVFNALGSTRAIIKGLKIAGAVGGNYCEPGCGQGIRGGTNLTVSDVRLTKNENNGIGGVSTGLVVTDSVVDGNGSRSFTILDPGTSSSAGIKSSKGTVTVTNSVIRDNYWNGVWCDIDCTALTVKNSVMTGNGKAGIQNEISSGPAVISGNTIKNNSTLFNANRHAGLLIVSSSHVDAYNNSFGGNAGPGVLVVDDGRSPGVSDVRIFDNTMNSDAIRGCLLSGVTCYGN